MLPLTENPATREICGGFRFLNNTKGMQAAKIHCEISEVYRKHYEQLNGTDMG